MLLLSLLLSLDYLVFLFLLLSSLLLSILSLLLLLLSVVSLLSLVLLLFFWRPIPTLAGRSELRVRAGDCVNVKFQTGKGTPINLEQ